MINLTLDILRNINEYNKESLFKDYIDKINNNKLIDNNILIIDYIINYKKSVNLKKVIEKTICKFNLNESELNILNIIRLMESIASYKYIDINKFTIKTEDQINKNKFDNSILTKNIKLNIINNGDLKNYIEVLIAVYIIDQLNKTLNSKYEYNKKIDYTKLLDNNLNETFNDFITNDKILDKRISLINKAYNTKNIKNRFFKINITIMCKYVESEMSKEDDYVNIIDDNVITNAIEWYVIKDINEFIKRMVKLTNKNELDINKYTENEILFPIFKLVFNLDFTNIKEYTELYSEYTEDKRYKNNYYILNKNSIYDVCLRNNYDFKELINIYEVAKNINIIYENFEIKNHDEIDINKFYEFYKDVLIWNKYCTEKNLDLKIEGFYRDIVNETDFKVNFLKSLVIGILPSILDTKNKDKNIKGNNRIDCRFEGLIRYIDMPRMLTSYLNMKKYLNIDKTELIFELFEIMVSEIENETFKNIKKSLNIFTLLSIYIEIYKIYLQSHAFNLLMLNSKQMMSILNIKERLKRLYEMDLEFDDEKLYKSPYDETILKSIRKDTVKDIAYSTETFLIEDKKAKIILKKLIEIEFGKFDLDYNKNIEITLSCNNILIDYKIV